MLPESPVSTLIAFLHRQSRAAIWAAALALVVLLGATDYATGFEVSFAFFYLLPVSLAAWALGRAAGAAVSLAAAATWHAANDLAGQVYSSALTAYWNTGTRLGFFFVVTLLLAALRKLLDHERSLARSDFLTGALNSRAFYDAVAIEISRSRRYGRPLTVVYMDLDNFKSVNDVEGHAAGDRALQTVGHSLSRATRVTDAVARLGGDEFAILMPETDGREAREIVPRLRATLLEEMTREHWPITFSFGVLSCDSPPGDVKELVRLADDLMYEVKRGGKNAIRYSGA